MTYNDFGKIQNEFPRVWRGGYLPLECGNGWLPLLRELSLKLYEAFSAEELAYTKILKVREKAGGLRIAFTSINATQALRKRIRTLVQETEAQSFKICEDCGSTEEIAIRGPWEKTLCVKCGD